MEKKQWTDFFADAFVLRLQYYGGGGGGVLNSVSGGNISRKLLVLNSVKLLNKTFEEPV